MRVQILEVPYDSGHARARMGRGPGALLAGGLVEALRADGHEVEVVSVEARTRFPTEVGTAWELARLLAAQVRAALWRGQRPLVLSGNCMAAVGVQGGLDAPDLGVLWMDAHGDFHTPETSVSGFLDGMALSVLTGGCWRTAAAAALPRLRPVPPARVVLAGARALDAGERARLEQAGVRLLPPADVPERLPAALDGLAARGAERLLLHLDLDVLDPDAVGRANAYAAPGGLGLEAALQAVRAAARRMPLAALTLSAYDPAEDPAGAVRGAAVQLARAALG